jgi:outer membrane biosynthesis protein TonB
MKWKFWKAEESTEPVAVEEVTEPEPEPVSQTSEPEPEPEPAALQEPEPAAPQEPEPDTVPAQVTLTIDEAKDAIREAGGDVIQVGFLASAYRRNYDEDPHSGDTAASRAKLRDLVGKRLKDRGLLAADGSVELRD